jgi:basic amino acid/polyamine antiporter, APA family
MIIGLDEDTLRVALVWMAIGLVVYFIYGRRNSKLRQYGEILPKASDFEKR